MSAGVLSLLSTPDILCITWVWPFWPPKVLAKTRNIYIAQDYTALVVCIHVHAHMIMACIQCTLHFMADSHNTLELNHYSIHFRTACIHLCVEQGLWLLLFYCMPLLKWCMYLYSPLGAGTCLLGADNTRHLLPLVIRRTGYAVAAVSLNMVHQSTVIVSLLTWHNLWILVEADKHGPSLVSIVFSHEPTAVLHLPS